MYAKETDCAARARADAGDDGLQAELAALGLKTISG